MSRTLALALSSGGARGFAHIGVLEVFEREGLPTDLIAGTSIGALIGCAYSLGMSVHEIEELALRMHMGRLVSVADLGRPTEALVSGRAVSRLVRQIAGGMTFADTEIPFACVAVDITSGREVVLREGSLTSAILASLSLPGVFPPVKRDGFLLVDGAVLNAVPVDVARDMGGDLVVAVTTQGSRLEAQALEPGNGGESSGTRAPAGSRDILERVSVRAATLAFDKVRAPHAYRHTARSLDLMVRKLAEPRLRAADLVIAPEVGDISRCGFYKAERIIDAGRQAAEKAVQELRRHLD